MTIVALITAGFVVWLIFVSVNVSVAFELAEDRGRRPVAWGLFAFLFPVVGPFLVYLLPSRTP